MVMFGLLIEFSAVGACKVPATTGFLVDRDKVRIMQPRNAPTMIDSWREAASASRSFTSGEIHRSPSWSLASRGILAPHIVSSRLSHQSTERLRQMHRDHLWQRAVYLNQRHYLLEICCAASRAATGRASRQGLCLNEEAMLFPRETLKD